MKQKRKLLLTIFSIVALVAWAGHSFYQSIPSKHHGSIAVPMKRIQSSLESIDQLIIPPAHASSDTMADNFADIVRLFYFMIAGFPGVTETASTLTVATDSVYYSINDKTATPCNATVGVDACDGPPPAGMLSLYNMIILGYQDSSWEGVSGILSDAGYTSCSSIPTTSTDLSPSSMTQLIIMAETPKVVIPTGHSGADGSSTYDRRLEVTYTENSDTMKFAVELNCLTSTELAAGKIQLYTAFLFPDPGGNRYIEFYTDKTDLDAQKHEFFMDYDSSTAGQFLALGMDINQTSGAISYDIIMTNQEGSNWNGNRINVSGNVTDDDFTVGFQSIGDQANSTPAAVASTSGADSTAITHTFTTCNSCNGPADDEYLIFCLQGDGSGTYTGPADADILNGDICTNLPLTANSSTPAIDSTNGAWNIQWSAATTGLDDVIFDGTF